MQEMQSSIMIIDRIEGGIAVCEAEDRSMIDVPLSELPEGAREGAVLRFENGRYSVDEAEERSRRERIESKAKRLFV